MLKNIQNKPLHSDIRWDSSVASPDAKAVTSAGLPHVRIEEDAHGVIHAFVEEGRRVEIHIVASNHTHGMVHVHTEKGGLVKVHTHVAGIDHTNLGINHNGPHADE